MPKHDAFISYATEDNDFAADLAFALKRNGLSVWFAPVSLRVGDKLLDSIESGLRESRAGILVLSRTYLGKGWTNFEMDTLLRQHIEKKMLLLPIWLDVTKAEVENRHAGLSGICAVTDTVSLGSVVGQLVASLSEGAPSRAVIPSWENPSHRFLQGLGEVTLQDERGPAATIFEFLLHANPDQYPLWLAGSLYSREELLLSVAEILVHVPERAKNYVSETEFKRLWDMCLESGIDPNMFY